MHHDPAFGGIALHSSIPTRRALPAAGRQPPATDPAAAKPSFNRHLPEGSTDRVRSASLSAPYWRWSGPGTGAVCRAVYRITEEVLGLQSYRELIGGGRRSACRRRHVAIYVCHVALGICHRDVAAAFGRDRTTIGYCCGVIEDRRDDPAFDDLVAMLERLVQAAFRWEVADYD